MTRMALTRTLEHAAAVGLSNTEESTFRAFFMAAAHHVLDAPRFQTEWKKFDLLVQADREATLVEFKYYLLRRNFDLSSAPGRRKGGPGSQNEAEFYACLNKLRDTVVEGIDHRRLVLVYQRDDRPTRRAFHRSYGELNRTALIAQV